MSVIRVKSANLLRRDTAANWSAKNPILREGEEGYETDTGRRKVGNGTTEWNELSYTVDQAYDPTSENAQSGKAVAEAVAQSGGGTVDDVQINGKSIVNEGIANIPPGNSNVLGVAKFNPSFGFRMNNNGIVSVEEASNVQIENRETAFGRPINTVNLDYAVKCAMCDGKGAVWTTEEQGAARERMGIEDNSVELIADITLEEETATVNITQFQDGTPLNLKTAYLLLSAPAVETSMTIWVSGMINTNTYNNAIRYYDNFFDTRAKTTMLQFNVNGLALPQVMTNGNVKGISLENLEVNNYLVKKVQLSKSGESADLPIGTNIKVYGVRANNENSRI